LLQGGSERERLSCPTGFHDPLKELIRVVNEKKNAMLKMNATISSNARRSALIFSTAAAPPTIMTAETIRKGYRRNDVRTIPRRMALHEALAGPGGILSRIPLACPASDRFSVSSPSPIVMTGFNVLAQAYNETAGGEPRERSR